MFEWLGNVKCVFVYVQYIYISINYKIYGVINTIQYWSSAVYLYIIQYTYTLTWQHLHNLFCLHSLYMNH